MTKLNLRKIAAQCSNRSKCTNCPISMQKCITGNYLDVCHKAYIKGFLRGVKHIKEVSK